MRAVCVDLRQVPGRPRQIDFDSYNRGIIVIPPDAEQDHYEAIVKVYPPFTYTRYDGESWRDAIRNLEREIIAAFQHMFDEPIEKERMFVASLLKCENCGATTNAHAPGPGWQEVQSLYPAGTPHYYSGRATEPRHFCTAQCIVNNILKSSSQPIVLTPLSR